MDLGGFREVGGLDTVEHVPHPRHMVSQQALLELGE